MPGAPRKKYPPGAGGRSESRCNGHVYNWLPDCCASGKAATPSGFHSTIHWVHVKDARRKLFRAAGLAAVVAVAAIVGSSPFPGEGRRGGMERHYAAHARSAHARVACRVCHVAHPVPGGARPPARICLECHPPREAVEDGLRVAERFAADARNSRTVLLMRMGAKRKWRGIHGAHLRAGVSILYTAADAKRQVIPRVEVRDPVRGRSEVYEDADAGRLPAGASAHTMDCTDCHNRTAHAFEPPSRALDRVMSAETLSPSLPLIKQAGLELLLARYTGPNEVLAGIRNGLARFYRERDPDAYEKRRAEIGGAADVLARIYQRDWATYPDNLGHTGFPGCFRCHDGRHTTPRGAVIPSDCEACHELLPVDEPGD